MAKPVLPITLQIGSTTAEVGTVELPLISRPAGRDAAGLWQVEFSVDHAEFRHQVALLLRSVADEFDKGAPADGDQ